MEHGPILAARSPAEGSVRRADTLAAILVQTQGDCPRDLVAAVEDAMAAGLAFDQTEGQIVLLEVLARVLEMADNRQGLGDALDVLAAMPAEAALAGFNTLVASSFPDGNVDIARLGDAALLVMAGLLASAGQIDDALAVLGTGAKSRPVEFLAKAHSVRGHMFGRDATTRALWTALSEAGTSPLDPRLYRHQARRLADAGDLAGALDALLTGACLPIEAADKDGFGDDFAVIAAVLHAIGRDDWLGQTVRLRFCLAACPAIAAEAAAALRNWPTGGAFDLYGPGLIAPVQQWFAAIALAPPPAYPLRHGKPHVDVV